jgi:hypothetical protein
MTSSVFCHKPDRIERLDVVVMEQSTVDDLPHIQSLWPAFEELVGRRGRKMFGRADLLLNTYTACTPVRADDDANVLGLQLGTLRGGSYLRGRMKGEPSTIYAAISDGMNELQAIEPVATTRPLIEFYRRHDEVELWLPIQARPKGRCGSPVGRY